jgi:hypothetical protein
MCFPVRATEPCLEKLFDVLNLSHSEVHDGELMRQCNGQAPPSKALVKGLAKELDIDESFLNRLAEEVRKDLG